ncbi:hypothetical protein ZEAMMB73_Zm00001d011601 [Zea mays]|uniref:Uncharacterized protein n=1 Tax=Zea mays TaxID=4577 RepID=A0A1D6G1Q8_MAIZE|nr:hypothetical protein ZEAMMB73_Zm00001d011601 [Zea mays]AQK97353.1 hypothetical protein ZEAMMB73_Zm00001d011601 [Zea mays]AQK97355.1 hypothetical protein ZEAMMB73_Zm00001d011601 [Zea mays]AQK97386.1 hypothetical protein ZEAMMB73_Zm00001d011601 [Zea mays]AQK97389.1 hypothetical protein ZEAMMB73_Zm00001d011601 [Zea mays]
MLHIHAKSLRCCKTTETECFMSFIMVLAETFCAQICLPDELISRLFMWLLILTPLRHIYTGLVVMGDMGTLVWQ